MSITCNLHTHSNFSDGSNTLEEMVQSAIAHNFISLGLSDHGYAPYDPAAVPLEQEPAYCAEVLRLKEKYRDQIEIALGYEHEALCPDNDLSHYDYVIESVHFVCCEGEYMGLDHSPEHPVRAANKYFGGDYYALCKAYYDVVCQSIEKTDAQIVGHIDLITKYNEQTPRIDTTDPRFLNPAMEAIRLAAERDLIVEINTGAMSRGYRTSPYPNPTLLKALKQAGGRIAISSDCHRAEWIDFAFDQAADLARSCGFTENWIWKDGKLCPTKL